MRLRLPLAALLAALSFAALAAPAGAYVIGIADQKPEMFSDPLFSKLHIRYARISVSWDAMTRDWEVAQLDQWMDAARLAGVRPLVAWDHSRGPNHRLLPKPRQFKHQFRRFRARYPWVKTFASWNEANHCGEPTCHKPKLVASYYRAMRHACGSCTLLAAEVIDLPNLGWWVDRFQRHLKVQPKIWGLHNYVDVNRLETRGTRTLLRHTRGRRHHPGSHIWFTETGGIVKRTNHSTIRFRESAHHAAKATRWLFHHLVPLSRRIKRVYVYQWNAGVGETWDSGLLNAHGHPRPAFGVVRRQVHVAAVARRRAAEARRRRRAAEARRHGSRRRAGAAARHRTAAHHRR